jgi:hypothetical protein
MFRPAAEGDSPCSSKCSSLQHARFSITQGLSNCGNVTYVCTGALCYLPPLCFIVWSPGPPIYAKPSLNHCHASGPGTHAPLLPCFKFGALGPQDLNFCDAMHRQTIQTSNLQGTPEGWPHPQWVSKGCRVYMPTGPTVLKLHLPAELLSPEPRSCHL